MTSPSARHARIMRIRQLEHMIAKARLRAADQALGNLHRISERIDALQMTLQPTAAQCAGQQLHIKTEMHQRLAKAQDDLVQPLCSARAEREALSKLSHAAYGQEETATKMHDNAIRKKKAASIQRADANRPTQRRKAGLS
jgi:hypothetical protein